MEIGVFTVLLGNKPFEEALDYLKELGISFIEIGTGNYPGNSHANCELLLSSEKELTKFKNAISKRNMKISALSCHGNPLHPQKKIANLHQETFKNTILLAKKLEVERVINFSGCPGDSENSKYPNWVVCPWPEDYLEVLNWQWKNEVIPYWKETAKFALKNGVNKICLEMHPGFVVYNPETLLRLIDAVGETIGANFDPSHLFWQGIDPSCAIRKLQNFIYHFHAKDVKIDKLNTIVNGVLDTKPYSDEINRSWIFRTVGYGHDYFVWKDIISNLRLVGYDYVLSIEHEDSLMSVGEGLKKAVDFLKQIVIEEQKSSMWWA